MSTESDVETGVDPHHPSRTSACSQSARNTEMSAESGKRNWKFQR